MHYIELYIFALGLYLNSLNHVTWKRLKVIVCGLLPLSWYANTWLDHDDVSIGLYCALLAPQWKANLRSTSVKVMNTWPLGYSITRIERQNRKLAPLLITTRPKMIISLYADKLGLSIRGSEILQKWLSLESRVIDCDSSRVILWKTWLESSHHVSQRDSSRVRLTKNRDTSHWLESHYHCKLHGSCGVMVWHCAFYGWGFRLESHLADFRFFFFSIFVLFFFYFFQAYVLRLRVSVRLGIRYR